MYGAVLKVPMAVTVTHVVEPETNSAFPREVPREIDHDAMGEKLHFTERMAENKGHLGKRFLVG